MDGMFIGWERITKTRTLIVYNSLEDMSHPKQQQYNNNNNNNNNIQNNLVAMAGGSMYSNGIQCLKIYQTFDMVLRN
jgi:hypothetical protein